MFLILLPLGTLAFCSRSNPINLPLFWNQNIMKEPGKRSTFFMRLDSILDEDILTKTWVKRIGFTCYFLRILRLTFLFYLLWCIIQVWRSCFHHWRYEDKVANFLTLSVANRSFKLEHSSLQEACSTTASMATSKDPSFPYFWDPKIIGIIRYIHDQKLLSPVPDSHSLI